ncbi:hypothetical protein ACFOVU_12545 [Nocardiopsis sediminis]|uniref:Uncharacterized protein n=1 Tax=Nocardiopsis sediminis TaxID=1778267 RepID=A0ABV8FQ34_9ACTN
MGFNWQHEKSDHWRAREIVHRLEDHRMLYDPYEAERIQPVIESAERLRDYLAEQIPQCESAALRDHLRDMQAAVRRCLTRIHRAQSRIDELWPAVSELRSRVGTTAEAIADRFDIPVNGDLARIVYNGESAVAARAAAFVRGSPRTPDGAPFPTCPSCGVHDSRIRWTADSPPGRSWWCTVCDTHWTIRWPTT